MLLRLLLILLLFLAFAPTQAQDNETKKHEAALALAALSVTPPFIVTKAPDLRIQEKPRIKKFKKELQCTICKKQFEHASRARMHQYSHFPETKPFACTWAGCQKRFSDRTHRKIHFGSHKRS